MMIRTQVICGFPCIGKSYFVKHSGLKVTDSDSSTYSWVIDGEGKKVRNEEFPNNYINHIKLMMKECDYVLVSTHFDVRKALTKASIPYTIIYPDISLKEEYVGRAFIRYYKDNKALNPKVIMDNWDNWMADMLYESAKNDHIILQHNEYLYDMKALFMRNSIPSIPETQEQLKAIKAIEDIEFILKNFKEAEQ